MKISIKNCVSHAIEQCTEDLFFVDYNFLCIQPENISFFCDELIEKEILFENIIKELFPGCKIDYVYLLEQIRNIVECTE